MHKVLFKLIQKNFQVVFQLLSIMFIHENLNSESIQTQKDYILEYVTRIDELLEASLSREALAEEDRLCRHCDNGFWAVWRCRDCCLGIPMCRGCIRSTHRENPLHRIEQWNGSFFRPAETWEVGTHILVRHHSGVSLCEDLHI